MIESAFLALGANLGDPQRSVESAIQALAEHSDLTLRARSSLYRTPPLGPPGQPDYINAVVCVRTNLAPLALLQQTQAIEQAHGRERGLRWGPRTLDIDLLLLDDQQLALPLLSIPHPEMFKRAFVLGPLSEIAPDWLHQGLSLSEHYQRFPEAERQSILTIGSSSLFGNIHNIVTP